MDSSLTSTNKKKIVRLANSDIGPKASLLEIDSELHKKHKLEFLSLWPSRKNDFFPAPSPVSFERKNLSRFKKHPYFVCVKSDGMRFVMICTIIENKHKCFMVDRAMRYYEVEQCFEESIYNGTIFDGELIKSKNENEWTYIIHDCIKFRGENVSQKIFIKRYQSWQSKLEKQIWISTRSKIL